MSKKKYSNYALKFAASNGHTETVKTLINAGMDTGNIDVDCLFRAAKNGYTKTLKVLIDAGVNIDAKNYNNENALMVAIRTNDTKAIQTLISLGANLSKEILAWSTRNGSPYTQFFLKHMENQNLAADPYIDALTSAASSGDIETIQTLIASGANINAKAPYSHSTALIFAAEKGHTEVVKFLITAGANINAINYKGSTALITAANYGNAEVIKVLASAGANLTIKNNGFSALSDAIIHGHTAAVQALIDGGANVNEKIYLQSIYSDLEPAISNITPLMIAAQGGHTEIVKALITAGANINDKDSSGSTALIYAAYSRHVDTAKTLIAEGADLTAGHNVFIASLFCILRPATAGVIIKAKISNIINNIKKSTSNPFKETPKTENNTTTPLPDTTTFAAQQGQESTPPHLHRTSIYTEYVKWLKELPLQYAICST